MPIQVLCNFKIASSRGPRPCDKVYPIIPHSSLNGYECYGAMAFSIETLQLYSDVGESLGHGPALSECLAQVSRSSPSMAHCQKQCQIPGRGVSGQKRVSSSTIFQGKRGNCSDPRPTNSDHMMNFPGTGTGRTISAARHLFPIRAGRLSLLYNRIYPRRISPGPLNRSGDQGGRQG